MANRRMFSLLVIDTDVFLDMPLSAQALYFHLSMRADDDGFIGNAKKIQRMIGSNDDDFKLLFAKGFLFKFDTGICVVKHWRIHNYIQKDRYTETIYQEEKKQIKKDKANVYQISKFNPNKELEHMDTQCIHDVSSSLPQDRLGKVSLDKESLEIYNSFIEICTSLPKPKKLTDTRKKAIKARLKEYDKETILEVFNKVEKSNFLSGRNGQWQASFDWIMKPSNFVKILEDNYKNKLIQPFKNTCDYQGEITEEELKQYDL